MPSVQPIPNYRTGEVPAIGDIITLSTNVLATSIYHYRVTRFTPARMYHVDLGHFGSPYYPNTNGYEDYTDKNDIRRMSLVRRGEGYKKPPSDAGFARFVRRIESEELKAPKRKRKI